MRALPTRKGEGSPFRFSENKNEGYKTNKIVPCKKGHGRQIKKGKRNQRVSPPPNQIKRMTMLHALPTGCFGLQSVGPRPGRRFHACNLQATARACALARALRYTTHQMFWIRTKKNDYINLMLLGNWR